MANLVVSVEVSAECHFGTRRLERIYQDHREKAAYMKNKGYEWNVYKYNYVEVVGKMKDVADRSQKAIGKKMGEGIDEYVEY